MNKLGRDVQSPIEVTVTAGSNNEVKVISSLEVAEMVEREHKNVMQDLRKINNQLNELKIQPVEFFVESTYQDVKGETRPCYLLTKKGCELYSTRMTGTKGTAFAIAYIERFNQMEQALSQQQDPITLALQAALDTRAQVQTIQEDVNTLKNTMRIDGVEQMQIHELGKNKVIKALGGYQTPAYNELSSKTFRKLWKDFKQYFSLPRYSELPKAQLAEAKQFISLWEPDAALKMEILSLQRQISFEEEPNR